MEYINCLQCGKSIPKYNIRRENGKIRYDKPRTLCSYQCVGRYNLKTSHQFGPNNHSWKGGRIKAPGGYVKIKVQENHPRKDQGGYVMEHIIVYEREHGCCLLMSAAVHHLNGDRRDNRPENLEAMTRKRHEKLTANQISQFTKLFRSFSWDKFIN